MVLVLKKKKSYKTLVSEENFFKNWLSKTNSTGSKNNCERKEPAQVILEPDRITNLEAANGWKDRDKGFPVSLQGAVCTCNERGQGDSEG